MEVGVQPKFYIKGSTFKESMDMITNGSVCVLDWSILMGRICPCQKNFIVPVGEDILDIRIGIELSTLV